MPEIETDSNKLKEFVKKWDSYLVLFIGYKDNSVLNQSFLFFYICRTIIYQILVVFFQSNPVAEVSLIVVLSLGILVFLIIKKPIRGRLASIEVITLEIIVLIANILVLVLAATEETYSEE